MCTSHAGSGFNALLQLKCPRCRRGKMFTHGAFNLRRFTNMNRHCPVCGQDFEPETGLYYSAMYISYAFSVALCITLAVAINVLMEDPDINLEIGLIVGAVLLSSPLSFRYARGITLHYLTRIRYDDSWRNRQPD
jgi:uncharacterized protein (DUF983 family)